MELITTVTDSAVVHGTLIYKLTGVTLEVRGGNHMNGIEGEGKSSLRLNETGFSSG